MSGERIAFVESGARLSVDRGRIKIERSGEPDRFVAAEDVAVFCLDHYGSEITKPALTRLAEVGAALIVTDALHMPAGIMLPLQTAFAAAQRVHQQVKFGTTDGPARLWGEIVAARIRTEASTLRAFDCNGALRLERMMTEIRNGDPENLEAQAAKHYWSYLFPDDFRREKQNAAQPLNQKLNYGYAILRAMIARQIAMSGLCPALGVRHRSSENPFNLADDLIEPYRFVVERKVKAELSASEPITREDRLELLRIVESEIRMLDQDWRLGSAIEETVESFCRCIARKGEPGLNLSS